MTPPLVLHVFSTFAVGGAQTRFAALANRFGRAARHVIVALDGRFDFADRLLPSLDVQLRQVAFNKGATLSSRRSFRAALKEIRPDILITHNWGTIEWAMANWPRLTRHIHIEDGFGSEEAQSQLRRRVWTRRLVLRGSTVIVPSRNLQRIAQTVWRLPEKNILYIPNGIDCARFAALPDPARMISWQGDGPVVGTVAALREEKNLARLIRAFATVTKERPCRLVIVGGGEERTRLEQLAAENGIADRVTFTGNVPDPEHLYRGFDVFALTSDTEQMPYTVIEAMAAARPIAATNVGDIRQMVSSANLPYIAARDDAAIADALRRLLADPALRERIGAANEEKALAEFDQTRMFAGYAQLYGIDAA